MIEPTKTTSLIYSPKIYVMRTPVYHKFYNDLGITEPFRQRDGWYEVFQDDNGEWWLYMNIGFEHNGADCFPDYSYMVFPSAVHDVGLWLIDWGIIPESNNNIVDQELRDCVELGNEPMPWWKGGNNRTARKIEAWKIYRATNLAKTKAGEKGSLEFLNKRVEI